MKYRSILLIFIAISLLPLAQAATDLNGDGNVDILDLTLVANCISGTCNGGEDQNNDGNVDILDLIILVNDFGPVQPNPTCGDGTCDSGESCSLCPQDCGTCQQQQDNTYWDSTNNVAVSTWAPRSGAAEYGVTWRPAGNPNSNIIPVQWGVTSPHTTQFPQQSTPIQTEANLFWRDSSGSIIGEKHPLGPVVTVPAAACTPSTEICDGIDNDCDGQTDEGGVCGTTPPPPPSQAGDPALPAAYPTPTRPTVLRTVPVATQTDLNNAILNAQPGDEIRVAPGVYEGTKFTLPKRNDNGWVILRTDIPDSQAPQGQRIDPNTNFATFQCKSPNPGQFNCNTLKMDPGASGWWLEVLEFTAADNEASNLFTVDGGSNVVLDRVYMHRMSSSHKLKRCFAANGANIAVLNSRFVDCTHPGFQAQAYWSGYGGGPLLIENSELQGSAQSVLFGGGNQPGGASDNPQDVTIRKSWIHQNPPVGGSHAPLETKNVQRILIQDSILEGSTAECLLLKSSDQSNNQNWQGTSDLTVKRSILRNCNSGVNMLRAQSQSGQNPFPMQNLLFEDVLVENLASSSGFMFQFLSAPHNVILRSVTSDNSGIQNSIKMYGGSNPKGSSLHFENTVLIGSTRFGVAIGDAGTSMSDHYQSITANNLYVEQSCSKFPSSGTTCTANPPAGAGANRAAILSATAGVDS